MSVQSRQIFYCFTAYDNYLKRKVRFNSNNLYEARYTHNETIMNKRYSQVGDIFTDTLELGSEKDTYLRSW